MSTHSVQFYESDEFLISTICKYFADSNVCIIIARSSLQSKIEKSLKINGVSAKEAKRAGNYLFLDAAKTLSSFMVKGLPHPHLFYIKVGALVEQMASKGSSIYAFGEMVALLWEEGNAAGAILLEELWNDLQKRYDFSLLCAYPMKNFGQNAPTLPFSYMCKCHTEVLPAEVV